MDFLHAKVIADLAYSQKRKEQAFYERHSLEGLHNFKRLFKFIRDKEFPGLKNFEQLGKLSTASTHETDINRR